MIELPDGAVAFPCLCDDACRTTPVALRVETFPLQDVALVSIGEDGQEIVVQLSELRDYLGRGS